MRAMCGKRAPAVRHGAPGPSQTGGGADSCTGAFVFWTRSAVPACAQGVNWSAGSGARRLVQEEAHRGRYGAVQQQAVLQQQIRTLCCLCVHMTNGWLLSEAHDPAHSTLAQAISIQNNMASSLTYCKAIAEQCAISTPEEQAHFLAHTAFGALCAARVSPAVG